MATVLIVDDNSEVCASLARLIRHLGHDGQCATSGQEALHFVEHRRPDLIILDVMMPGMGGMEVLQQLKMDQATKDLVVVMFSAVGDDDSRKLALSSGAADYWLKASVDFEELARRIQIYIAPVAPPAN